MEQLGVSVFAQDRNTMALANILSWNQQHTDNEVLTNSVRQSCYPISIYVNKEQTLSVYLVSTVTHNLFVMLLRLQDCLRCQPPKEVLLVFRLFRFDSVRQKARWLLNSSDKLYCL